MKHSEYPALFKSASDLSARAQKNFFRAFKLHLGLLIVAAIISMVNSADPLLSIAQAMTLMCALGCAIYLYSVKPDRQWYSARALAESVKTSCWRFVTRAEPFGNPDEQDRHNFVQRLKQVLDSNKDVAGRLNTYLDKSQITDEMERIRGLSTRDRQAYYRDHRIADQLSWYARKAAFNRRMATAFYVALFVTIFVAIVFALGKIRFPSAPYWPTDAFITLAASLLSWIQAKRFQELAVSYALTAHEISFIRQRAEAAANDTELAAFVGDAENAFSREHTQWVARRDT
ncbi:hypothetical protein CJO94_00930 [Ralstonia solanacearum]|nr:hypothetical protein CJO94_00930 [Ralstonia solanacearum]